MAQAPAHHSPLASIAEARAKFSWTDPVQLIATWFGVGLLPKMPGTFGTLAAVPFGVALYLIGGPWLLIVAALAVFPLGCWAAARYVVALNRPDDPGEVVVDEVVALWLCLALAGISPLGVVLSVVLFRVFDIVKVWPARWLDRRIKGGIGIMVDDLAASAYALIILAVLRGQGMLP